ncbi:transporter substrate-binding domain-containing protein [Leptospira borgpetersenii]|uniref:Substrate binding protein of an ABC transporter complex n=1 Tax=Leptospira borgpetersenii serovar Hardjo-bovis (strain JB197) TaxID=355277 RepID=Q04NX7_LEPBJ|nr:transporter substrate-binding domain-containing protein [Leptospira borgpetersenii]ABJ77393.1 Substrate binding protein of an ABC transporter complex [Leptospira borgpetersenii serovar Hardjo-bovis str. JB197]AMX56905.1 ABC transporter substrate-binding protein [Leptospira borgpetersenii serovar Hardjo]AMX60136.1 ABC transporter substrate-binding protein [Leptospira borgpetersenii serovar Hardjo]AMX63383.1 ABC transporter substrate-binding protein [Leptospira borgpetersenii serovar Hardjo]A
MLAIRILCLFLVFPAVLFSQSEYAGSRLERILSRKELVVGVNKYYEPFYIENPKDGYPGVDAELAKLYADYLGVSLKLVPLKTFRQFAEDIRIGKIDLAFAGISTDLNRGKQVTFSDPYLVTTPAGLVSKKILPPEPEGNIVISRRFMSLSDLANLSGLVSFSVRSNTTNHIYLQKKFSKLPIYSYLSDSIAIDNLISNNVTCFVADSFFILTLLQKNPSLKANYLPLLGTVQEENISAALPLNDLIFADNLNFFIKELKRTGLLEELKNRYFNQNSWVK